MAMAGGPADKINGLFLQYLSQIIALPGSIPQLEHH